MSSEEVFDGDEETDDGRIVSARNPELARQMEELRKLAEQADLMAKQNLKMANEQAERIEELEAENADLRRRLDDIEDSQSIVADVNDSRAMDVDDRAVVCVQTLANDAGADGKASMTISEGWSTLGREFDRTRMYDVYKRAESLVEDNDVCWYQKEPRSSNKVSRLILDRTHGDLPEKAAGKRLKGGRSR